MHTRRGNWSRGGPVERVRIRRHCGPLCSKLVAAISGSICIAVVVSVSVGVVVFSEQAVVVVEGVGLAGRVELLSYNMNGDAALDVLDHAPDYFYSNRYNATLSNETLFGFLSFFYRFFIRCLVRGRIVQVFRHHPRRHLFFLLRFPSDISLPIFLQVLSCACVCRCRGCFLCRCVLCACDLLIVLQDHPHSNRYNATVSSEKMFLFLLFFTRCLVRRRTF